MHDPERSDGPSSGGVPERAALADRAREQVLRVVSWYSGRILAAHRAGSTEEMERLLAGQRACKADLRVLQDADEATSARIAQRYAGLYRELTGEA